ncbi:MAG: M3 family metallopeptidase [Xanthomonadales bacterium]|nr:M3 family metallopeptidase [Xanthomonadales bacterium]
MSVPIPDLQRFDPAAAALAVRAELARRAVDREAALAAGRPRFHALIGALEASEARLEERFAPLAHLNRVRCDAGLRALHDRLLDERTAQLAAEGRDPRLLAAVARVLAEEELGAAERAVAERWARALRAAGAGLPEADRARLLAIDRELARLEAEYEYAVTEAEDAFALEVEAAALPDLAPEERAPLEAAARAAGQGGLRLGLRAAEARLVLERSPDRGLREEIYRARAVRASELGHPRHCDNGPRLRRILALRAERAALLGQPSPAHEVFLEERMAERPETALGFLRELGQALRPLAERELERLRDFARRRLGLGDLAPWDLEWVLARLRREALGLDPPGFRFPLDTALAGIARFLHRFGLDLAPAALPAYEGASWWALRGADGATLALVLLDLEARPGKQDGAWAEAWRPGRADRPALAALVADALPGTAGRAPRLAPEELLTLFHEFGHLVHEACDRSGWPSLAGTGGAPFDGVELPSMLLESLARSPEALGACAGAEEPLDAGLAERLLAGLGLDRALSLLRQVELARFDLELHLDPAADPLALLARIRADTALLPVPAWDRLPCHFGHLFGGGYEAGYYGYLWAEGLARQVMAALARGRSGADFIAEVLAPGEVEPLAERLRRFLGEPPDPLAPLVAAAGGTARRAP